MVEEKWAERGDHFEVITNVVEEQWAERGDLFEVIKECGRREMG